MTNCHSDLLAFHDEKITLPKKERDEMRRRRDANRERLKRGLRRDDHAQPFQIRSQGSYAMWTMVQQPDKDYDIDDGVYFRIDDLPDGEETLPREAKDMVCRAVKDRSFKRQPEVRENCVRVYYDGGYHIDLPVYRRPDGGADSGHSDNTDELASGEWTPSDPVAVTEWFLTKNRQQSPDHKDNGGQLRRIVRLLKGFARSRKEWRKQIANGFTVTKLVTEHYQRNADREDVCLHDTMRGIRERLRVNLEVEHPVLPEKLTEGSDDPKTSFLLEKLDWAIQTLTPLLDPHCSRRDALDAWGLVFNTTFFEDRPDADDSGSTSGGSTHGHLRRPITPTRPVDKRGSGTFG